MEGAFVGIKRPKYFTGQLLTAEDFQCEQEYFRHKILLHNRCFHGYGVACGLEISIVNGDSPRITIEPGVALDARGNMIEVNEPQHVTLKAPNKQSVCYVVLEYREFLTDPVPAPPNLEPRDSGAGTAQASRVEETFELSLQANNPLTHRKCEDGHNACGNPHPLPLGRLRRLRKRWVLDPKFVPPRCMGL
jgi:hypothetical protein